MVERNVRDGVTSCFFSYRSVLIPHSQFFFFFKLWKKKFQRRGSMKPLSTLMNEKISEMLNHYPLVCICAWSLPLLRRLCPRPWGWWWWRRPGSRSTGRCCTGTPPRPPGWSVSAVAQTRPDRSPGEPDTQRAC